MIEASRRRLAFVAVLLSTVRNRKRGAIAMLGVSWTSTALSNRCCALSDTLSL